MRNACLELFRWLARHSFGRGEVFIKIWSFPFIQNQFGLKSGSDAFQPRMLMKIDGKLGILNVVLPMVLGYLCFKIHWFHNQWVQTPSQFSFPWQKKTELQVTHFHLRGKKQHHGSWGVSRIPAKIKEGWKLKLEIIFLVGQETLRGLQRTPRSVCECLTGEENMELWLCQVKLQVPH